MASMDATPRAGFKMQRRLGDTRTTVLVGATLSLLASCGGSRVLAPEAPAISGAGGLVSAPRLSAPWSCEGGLERGAMLSEVKCIADHRDGFRVMVTAKVYAVPAHERADADALCLEDHRTTYAPLFTGLPVVDTQRRTHQGRSACQVEVRGDMGGEAGLMRDLMMPAGEHILLISVGGPAARVEADPTRQIARWFDEVRFQATLDQPQSPESADAPVPNAPPSTP